MLYGSIKAAMRDKSKDVFDIICPYSKKKYTFETSYASEWVEAIKRVIMDIKLHEENSENYLS